MWWWWVDTTLNIVFALGQDLGWRLEFRSKLNNYKLYLFFWFLILWEFLVGQLLLVYKVFILINPVCFSIFLCSGTLIKFPVEISHNLQRLYPVTRSYKCHYDASTELGMNGHTAIVGKYPGVIQLNLNKLWTYYSCQKETWGVRQVYSPLDISAGLAVGHYFWHYFLFHLILEQAAVLKSVGN